MFMIETERLLIRPLTADELRCYSDSPLELVRILGLQTPVTPVGTELKAAIENTFLPNLEDESKSPLFNTVWIIIEKNKQCIIGGLCFHGEPDSNGMAEIGYGIDDAFQNSGFMSEAVSGIIDWSKKQEIIKTLVAETYSSNLASIRVLEKCGFRLIKSTDTGLCLIMNFDVKEGSIQIITLFVFISL